MEIGFSHDIYVSYRLVPKKKAKNCHESHDGEHHFPMNVHTRIERPDCIYCGRTKAQVAAGAIFNEVRKHRPDLDVPIEPIERPPIIEDS